ncbi:hypothetical protein Leryth_024944 [Lithospermum erythrorhizon]|nr:hypothetical protein Leryth_024944 [Lithospermum erythrorhizon]
MADVVLFVDVSYYTETYLCRICHEEEWESSSSLEAPCSCSGTVKYAHRDCIQRWCNEKGNTVCELCLQKFEPGYTSPPKNRELPDTTITIRESEEVSRREMDIDDPEIGDMAERQINETEYSECSSATDKSVSFCRRVAFLFTFILIARHILAVVAGKYMIILLPFTLVMIKTSGIIFPIYILIRIIRAVHHNIRHHHHQEHESDDEDIQTQSLNED